MPVAALFLALIAFALWKGFRKWKAESEGHDGKTVRQSNGQPVDGSTAGGNHGTTEDALTMLGVTMALTAYLLTQMTANSLNVYVSNQFFFWLLMAALLCARPKSEVEGLRSKVEIQSRGKGRE